MIRPVQPLRNRLYLLGLLVSLALCAHLVAKVITG
jgi:hypothetical protein